MDKKVNVVVDFDEEYVKLKEKIQKLDSQDEEGNNFSVNEEGLMMYRDKIYIPKIKT